MSDLASEVTRSSKLTVFETCIATSSPKGVSNPNLFDCRKRYHSILLKVKDMPNLNTRLKNNYIYYPVQSINGKDFIDVIIKFNVFIYFFK